MTDFRNIWMPLAERFYRAAYYMLESQQDAEDAVQELYLRIWKSHANLTDLKSPVAYGMSLLKNICIDRIRRREIRKHEFLDVGTPDHSPPPERNLDSKDLLKKVQASPFPNTGLVIRSSNERAISLIRASSCVTNSPPDHFVM